MQCWFCSSKLLCFSGARQDSDPPSILSLFSWSPDKLFLLTEKIPLLGIFSTASWEDSSSRSSSCFVQCKFKPSSDEEALYSSARSANPHLRSFFAQHTFCELSVNLCQHMLYNHILLKTCGYQFLHSIDPFLIKIKKIYLWISIFKFWSWI